MRRGFTLIELLVVIAIIAILAAILFPVFLRVKVTANTTKCGAHGRELGVAMSMYLDDYAGRFPSECTDAMLAPFDHITWHYRWPAYPPTYSDVCGVGGMNQYEYIQLAPYVKNVQIWICPSPTTMHSMKYAYKYRCSWFFRTSNLGVSGYPDNPFQETRKQPDGTNRAIGLTVPEVQAKDSAGGRYCPPSKKFFAWCYSLGDSYGVQPYTNAGYDITPSYAHDEGSVFVYLDTHARYHDIGHGFAPVYYTDNVIDQPHTH